MSTRAARATRWTGQIDRWIDAQHPAAIAIALLGAFLAVSWPLRDRFYVLGLMDIGEYVNNPMRMLIGQLPYRDFWLFHPPGEVGLPYLIYRLGGLQINHIFTANLLINALAGAYGLLFARHLGLSNRLASLVTLLVFFNGIPTLTSMAVSFPSSQGFLALLLTASALVKFFRRERAHDLLLAGAGAGLACVFRFFESLPAVAAFALVLLMHPGAARMRLQRLGYFLAGMLTVLAAVSIAFWPVRAQMVREVAVNALMHHQRAFYGVAPWLAIQDQIAKVWQRAGDALATGSALAAAKWLFRLSDLFNSLCLYVMPVVVGMAGVRMLRRANMPRWEQSALLLALLWGVLGLAKATCYPVRYYWINGTTPLLFALGILLQRRRALPPSFGRILVTLTAALALWVPVSLGLVLLRVRTVVAEVAGPYGRLYVEDAAAAAAMQGLVDRILDQTEAGGHVFVGFVHVPPLYAMTGRQNPTHYDSFLSLYADRQAGVSTSAEEWRVCQAVTRADTRLAILDASPEVAAVFPDLQSCIVSMFSRVEHVGPYAVHSAQKAEAIHGG